MLLIESESLCKRCGLCCSFYLNCVDTSIYLPSFKCKHLQQTATGKTNCDCYLTRKCPSISVIAKLGNVPSSCAYFLGGKHRRVATRIEEMILIRTMPEEQFKSVLRNFNVV